MADINGGGYRASPKISVVVGGTVTLIVFFLGLLIKGQSEIAALAQREIDHHNEIEGTLTLLQADISRRFEALHDATHDRQEQLGRVDDAAIKREEELSLRVTEIQRQVSVIEGKLDLFNMPPSKRTPR